MVQVVYLFTLSFIYCWKNVAFLVFINELLANDFILVRTIFLMLLFPRNRD